MSAAILVRPAPRSITQCPARFGVEARITEFNATLEPIMAGLVADARVAVVSMMGSLAPVTVAHTGALEYSRKVLMGEYAHEFTPRPYQLVVCFLRQNHAEYMAQNASQIQLTQTQLRIFFWRLDFTEH